MMFSFVRIFISYLLSILADITTIYFFCTQYILDDFFDGCISFPLGKENTTQYDGKTLGIMSLHRIFNHIIIRIGNLTTDSAQLCAGSKTDEFPEHRKTEVFLVSGDIVVFGFGICITILAYIITELGIGIVNDRQAVCLVFPPCLLIREGTEYSRLILGDKVGQEISQII